MISNRKALVVFVCVLAVCFNAKSALADGVTTKTDKPLSDLELSAFQYCGTDRDCVKAVNGCCDCANGGVDVAVNKEKLSQFSSHFDCNSTSCENTNNQQCGTGVVSCIELKCHYLPPSK